MKGSHLLCEGLSAHNKQQLIHLAAQQEARSTALQAVLRGHGLSEEAMAILQSLDLSGARWQVCLIHSADPCSRDLQQRLQHFLWEQEQLYLLPLTERQWAIVFAVRGYGAERELDKRLQDLSARLARFRTHMACGSSQASILHIAASMRDAQEAIAHKFYDITYMGVLSIHSVQGRGFTNGYGEAAPWLNRILGSLATLDWAEYVDAAAAAAAGFKARRVHPEQVKTMTAYCMHHVREYVRGSMSRHPAAAAEPPDFLEVDLSVIGLDALMERVSQYGQACFRQLLLCREEEALGVVQEINAYLKEHYQEKLSIKSLAKRFYLHPAYLGQLLRKKNGVSFHIFVHDLRIQEAARLLQEVQYSITEIAERVGYSNYSHFLKEFEKRLHISPMKYRKSIPSLKEHLKP
ncbi:helix-turn-helix domain-containing protein [Paenibacillus sp. F411]|uniref:helix-turn-helix transcriptional regulator n=1 Tax=Paenibacillus sp. F411 TaxID=2820239 RepID=UPI001AAEF1D9|nr:AraC family transcriptional regulator [Paenibacillus sp. F411]MBO2944368.1 helix-turn-helix domain-containing protein [Paenibacillus sp. F411]